MGWCIKKCGVVSADCRPKKSSSAKHKTPQRIVPMYQRVATPRGTKKSGFELANLPKVTTPESAVAVAMQSHRDVRLFAPRCMSTSPIATDRFMLYPSVGSAMHLTPLWHGYMSACSAAFATEATDVSPMLITEELEIKDAALGTMSQDGSLPPRGTSAWLLVLGGATETNVGRAYVDAFAEIAAATKNSSGDVSPIAKDVRMSILAGEDAIFAMQRFMKDMKVTNDSLLCGAKVVLVVRWGAGRIDGSMDAVARAEAHVMPSAPSSNNKQSMHEECIGSICCGMLTSITNNGLKHIPRLAACVPRFGIDGFVQSAVRASKDFFAEMSGGEVVTLSPYVTSSAFADTKLEDSCVFVRMVPKNADGDSAEQKLVSNSCFHTILLCNPEHTVSVMAWASQHYNTPLEDVDYSCNEWGLHLCGSWAEPQHLCDKVSLYAPSGRCREPISMPFSKVCKHTTVICPFDARMFQAYDMYSCGKECVLPGDERLFTPFRVMMRPVFESLNNLSTRFDRQNRHEQMRRLHLASLVIEGSSISADLSRSFSYSSNMDCMSEASSAENHLLPIRAFEATGDSNEVATETYLLDAFGINLGSRRVTVGEAYSRMSKRGAPSEITNLLLEACMNPGSASSLCDTMIEATKCMELIRKRKYDDHSNPFIANSEKARLIRVADAALKVNVEQESVRPFAPVTVMPATQIRHLMSAVGLKRGLDVRVDFSSGRLSEENADKIMKVLSQSLRSEMNNEANNQAKQLLTCPMLSIANRDKTSIGLLRGMVASTASVLTQHMDNKPQPFLISSDTGGTGGTGTGGGGIGEVQENIRFERIYSDGTIMPTTPGDLVNAAGSNVQPHVLFANYSENMPPCITATVPLDTQTPR